MRAQTIFYITVVLIVAIAIANGIALASGLYWRWSWFDIPMHFFGGFWLGLFAAWLGHFSGMIAAPVRAWPIWVLTISTALGLGLIWEGYEIAIGATYLSSPYLADTLFDLVMDTLGGVAAWGIVKTVRTAWTQLPS
jgi:hypothetical protein